MVGVQPVLDLAQIHRLGDYGIVVRHLSGVDRHSKPFPVSAKAVFQLPENTAALLSEVRILPGRHVLGGRRRGAVPVACNSNDAASGTVLAEV